MRGKNEDAYVWSNNHVLAANNAWDIWDEIIQPGPADNGRIGDDTLAYLDHSVPLNPQGPNCADVAVALVRGNTGKNEWRKFAVFYISAICYSQLVSRNLKSRYWYDSSENW